MTFARLRAAILDAFLPLKARCMACDERAGIDGEWLCSACRAKYRAVNAGLFDVDWPLDGLSLAYAAHTYGEIESKLVQAFKFNGVWLISEMMAEEMLAVLRALNAPKFDCVTPAPLHWLRYLRRGYNQSELLARRIAGELGVPLKLDLKKARYTRKQSRLSSAKRLKNVAGAYKSAASYEGLRVLLVDDVMTTGATAHQCAAALRRAGARDVRLVAYACAGRLLPATRRMPR